MGAGRPRKSAAAKAIRGQFLAGGKPVMAESGRPDPPDRVRADPVTLEMWTWVADQCEKMGVLTLADRLALELISTEYAELQRANQIVAEDGMILVGPKGGQYSHPAINVAAACKKRISTAMDSLGLTPRAREQLNVQMEKIRPPGKLSLAEYNARNPAKNA